jgi:hypothetical protein
MSCIQNRRLENKIYHHRAYSHHIFTPARADRLVPKRVFHTVHARRYCSRYTLQTHTRQSASYTCRLCRSHHYQYHAFIRRMHTYLHTLYSHLHTRIGSWPKPESFPFHNGAALTFRFSPTASNTCPSPNSHYHQPYSHPQFTPAHETKKSPPPRHPPRMIRGVCRRRGAFFAFGWRACQMCARTSCKAAHSR